MPVNDTASDQAIPKYLTETPPEHRPGVYKEDGKVFISDDSRRMLTDADYRAATFPETYTFEAVPGLLEKGEIQLSLWYLVNLFDENQTLTLQIVADLQKAGIRAEHFVNAFHSYVFADPEIMSFENGTVALIDPQEMRYKASIAKYLGRFVQQKGSKP